MEPDKFEKRIKNALAEREIKPSENAWEKISEQLPVAEPKKSNKFFWYSVAAVFIGGLIISSFYFNEPEEAINSNIQIVKTPIKRIDTTINNPNLIEQNELLDVVVESKVNGVKKDKPPKKSISTVIIDEQQIAKANEVTSEEIINKSLVNEKEQLFETKIAEVVAQVNLLELNNQSVSNKEVDSLLRKAQQEVLADKVFNQKGEVDAIALLNQVEGELDQTFREQIFKTLKEGFLKVKTAVADRNN